MKIMFLVPCFHSDQMKPYKKFSAGLAFTIESIITYFGKQGHHTFVYAQSAFSKGYKKGNIEYLPKRFMDIFPLPFWYLKEFVKDVRGQKMSLRYWIHVLSYYLYGGKVERYIRKIKPDIVSIRGVGYITRPYVLACQRTRTKYIVSLHGLIAYLEGPSVLITEREKEMEEEVFKNAIYKGIPLTVIGSGIKERMLRKLGENDCEQIYVVNNGINKKVTEQDESSIKDIRDQYQIAPEDKVIISAAHIIERKNQMQIFRAYRLLPEKIKAHTKLLFLGTGDMQEELESEIVKAKLEDKVFLCGFIDNKEIASYFCLSDINVIASLDEGFGRAFIEGFLYGVPAVTYADLDAVKDLYDEKAMVTVNERTDKKLAEGLLAALNIEWDKAAIIRHGEKFSIEHMGKLYEDIYKNYIKSC